MAGGGGGGGGELAPLFKSSKGLPAPLRHGVDAVLILLHAELEPAQLVRGKDGRAFLADSWRHAAPLFEAGALSARLGSFARDAVSDEQAELLAPYVHADGLTVSESMRRAHPVLAALARCCLLYTSPSPRD